VQHIGGLLFLGIEHLLAQIAGGHVENAGEQLAVFQEQPRLDVIARRYPLVEPRALLAGARDGGIGRRPRDADLAPLSISLRRLSSAIHRP
jgi:hypothetical protein